jgi:5'-deoxynucleotidase YfbR-like HD superfamily hydrolase
MKNRYVDLIYRLKNIKRFNNRAVIAPYNVSQHSFYVAHICLYIAELENLRRDKENRYDILKLLKKAMSHDVAEAACGDILWPIKNYDEDIHKKINDIEEIIVRRDLLKYMPVELQDSFADNILKAKKDMEGELVNFSDSLEVLFYLTEERKLGNMGTWIDETFENVIPITDVLSKNIPTGRRLMEHVIEEFKQYGKLPKKNDDSSKD